jgi:hypothetical protein
MRARWLLPLLILIAALGGYAAGGHPLTAQTDPLPFAVGDAVRFTWPDNSIRDCHIEDLRGMFVLCRRAPREGSAYHWMNVSAMISVEVKVRR